MARMIDAIPGFEMTVTNVRKGGDDIVLEIAARVTNWWRLLFWHVREYYDIPWHVWPYALLLVAIHGLKGELGFYD